MASTSVAVDGWAVLARVVTPHRHTVTKYRATATGLTVLHVDVPGPVVEGYFVLATEALDDDGCPHTLEHLIFLGSEDYPYKGVLDRLANRSIAQGTNAWTDIDHTCYTISTAGKDGFLNVFPVYVDHILYPTLTDSGCYTEVHHIDGDGNNAGVVYCEMQGRENGAEDRVDRRLRQLLYPEGCGYRSETGGMLSNLRALHVDTIRKYHRDYYRPDNLCCVVVGTVPEAELLGSLAKIQAKIVSKGPLHPQQRPWVSSPPIPPLTASSTETVEFPEEEEDSPGLVSIAWRGPLYMNYEDREALNVLLDYLTDSAVSLLRQTFCEIAEPLCSAVDGQMNVNTEGALQLRFSGVPAQHVAEIRPKLLALLGDHAKGDAIDMARIDLTIQRQILRSAANAEVAPADTYLGELLGDILYGPADGSDLGASLASIPRLAELRKRERPYWRALLRKYFVDRPYVCVEGVPSVRLAKDLEQAENERLAKQRAELGAAKLAELGKQLQQMTAANTVEIPTAVLDAFRIPSLTTISLIPITSSRDPSNNPVRDKLEGDFPEMALGLDLHFDHIPSKFVVIRAFIDTTGLPRAQRLWLPVLIDTLFETSIHRPGEAAVPLNEVVRQLDVDAVAHNAAVGIPGSPGLFACGPFGAWLQVVIKAEASKYPQAVRWLHDVLWHAEYSAERLKTVVAKLLNDIPEFKREGNAMAATGLQMLAFDTDTSNNAAVSAMVQEHFLQAVAKSLGVDLAPQDDDAEHEGEDAEDGGDEGDSAADEAVAKAVLAGVELADPVEALHALRRSLCSTERMVVQVSGDILALPSPRHPWLDAFRDAVQPTVRTYKAPTRTPTSMMSQAHLSALGRTPGRQAHVVVLPAIESSFAVHTTRAPGDYHDSDVPALHVLGEYLSMMEGVLWKNVRGLGLAYGCSVSQNTDQSLLNFTVYRSPNAAAALEQVQRIVTRIVQGSLAIDEADVTAAKCGVVFSVVNKEDNMENAAVQRLLNEVFKQTGAEGTRTFLAAVERVTSDDLRRVLQKYLKHLVDPAQSLAVVVTAPTKAKLIVAGYRKLGYTVTEHSSLDAFTAAVVTAHV